MGDWMGILLIYLLGTGLLVAELFLPAHGVIGVVGLGVLGFGLYETYMLNEFAGLIGTVVLAVMIPAGLLVSVRCWYRTPVGKRIAPANPRLGDRDRMPIAELQALIGQVGRAMSKLRPVGTCEFNGRRVECAAEYGVIEKDARVEAIRLADRTLTVRELKAPATQAAADVNRAGSGEQRMEN